MGFDAAPASEAEKEQLKALRAALADEAIPPVPGPAIDEDLNLLRFVRGYAREKRPIQAAARAFKSMLQWRAQNGMDAARGEMLAGPGDEPRWPLELERFATLKAQTGDGLARRLGTSRDGMPVTLCLIHRYDVSGVLRARLGDDLLAFQRYLDEYWLVELQRRSRSVGRVVGRIDLVYTADMKLNHFGFKAIAFFPKILGGSKHYPESAARIVSIGNNKVAVALYNRVIRPFVPAHTKEKLTILGRDLESESIVACMDLDEPTTAALHAAIAGGRPGGAAPSARAPDDDDDEPAPPPPSPGEDDYVLVEPPSPPDHRRGFPP